MSYSTLMAHLELDRPCETPLRIANELARTVESKRIVGIAAAAVEPPLYFTIGPAAEDLLRKDRERLNSQLATREAEFRRLLPHVDVEWRGAVVARPVDFVARNARAADLILTSRCAGRSDSRGGIDSGELVLLAGRPVLVVPPEVEWLRFNTMLIAWKDTREARRAVNDALPLLHQARQVLIVESVEPGPDEMDAKMRVQDVAHWLVRRGISASAIATRTLTDAAEHISMLAREEGANIIVAGAYGHTRFNEWVFGGVTRSLLMQKDCSVLFSH